MSGALLKTASTVAPLRGYNNFRNDLACWFINSDGRFVIKHGIKNETPSAAVNRSIFRSVPNLFARMNNLYVITIIIVIMQFYFQFH